MNYYDELDDFHELGEIMSQYNLCAKELKKLGENEIDEELFAKGDGGERDSRPYGYDAAIQSECDCDCEYEGSCRKCFTAS